MNGFVTGLLHLDLTNGKNYLLPCDIEWGLEGKYLIFPLRYYKVVSDDLFSIKNIQILDDGKIICRLYNPIRPEFGQEFYEIIVQLDSQNYNKIIKSGVADNSIDISVEMPEFLHTPDEEIPDAILEKEETKEVPIKRTEVGPDDTPVSLETVKPVKKPRWYKFWRYIF